MSIEYKIFIKLIYKIGSNELSNINNKDKKYLPEQLILY